MKDYKVNQTIYHKTQAITDYIEDIGYCEKTLEGGALVELITAYFKDDLKPVFPAKSYSVAIIYSKLLEKYFGENFYTVLSDRDLFLGTDRYFKAYGEDKDTYDKAITHLKNLKLMDFERSSLGQVQKTIDYFFAEFLLKERDKNDSYIK